MPYVQQQVEFIAHASLTFWRDLSTISEKQAMQNMEKRHQKVSNTEHRRSRRKGEQCKNEGT
jgi:hypothetical protein